MLNFKQILIFILLSFILATFFTPVIVNKFQIDRLNEPKFGTYTSDEASFLKVFYLMKQNLGYYQAFKLSRENGASGNNLQRDIFTWRMPTVFYLWKVVADNGKNIFQLFILLNFLFLLSSYLILKKVINQKYAVLGPLLFLPYLYDNFRYKTAFLFTEWWGFLFFGLGLAALVYHRGKTTFLFFLLAVATRELFIIPLSTFLFIGILRKKDFKPILGAIVLGLIVYFVHNLKINNILGTNTDYNFFSRLHTYHFADLQRMISFSMKEYVFSGFKSHYIFLAFGIIGLIIATFKKNTASLYLISTILSFILFLPFISTLDNDYWGILFVPLIITSIPLIFGLL